MKLKLGIDKQNQIRNWSNSNDTWPYRAITHTSLLFSCSSGDCSTQRWILSSPLHTPAMAPLLQATQPRAHLHKATHLRVILHRDILWTWSSLIQLTLTTLPDQWAPEAPILGQDSLLIKDTLDNHSLAGRAGPLLDPCMGKLPKTQVSGSTQQRLMPIYS